MEQPPFSLPNYNELSLQVQQIDSKADASQVHGLVCGLICANKIEVNAWHKLIFPKNKKKAKIIDCLDPLYKSTLRQLSDFMLEFTLILPDDEEDINKRAEALGLWCQGFMTGLKDGGFLSGPDMPSELTEALKDLTEISQLSFGDISTDEEDEVAYTELVEYVRLSVVMIFQELRPENQILGERDILH